MTKKIKVLFVDHTPFPGGAQLCLASHIKHLDREQITPFLVTDAHSEWNKIYEDSQVTQFPIEFHQLKVVSPISLWNLKESSHQFSTVISEVEPDVVVANTTRALIVSA